MADWEHKDATWFWDRGQRRMEFKKNRVEWTLRLWVSEDGPPSIISKHWHLPIVSPEADESQKESFNDECKKIGKEFGDILQLQLKFSEWLNLQTKDGWEVFKISRRESGTWGVFRRKTE